MYDKLNIHSAMIYSFYVVTGKKTIIDLIISEKGIFVFNPEKPLTKDTLEEMIEYFENVEDYKKCLQLKKLLEDGSIIGKNFTDV